MFIKVAQPCVGKEEVQAAKRVILSGQYVSGVCVSDFEEKFSRYLGARYAVAVNSGTAALHIGLAVLGIGRGDEVIVPPLTFFATVSSVLHQNATPVFADINPHSYCLDPESVEKVITKKTRAIIPVHLYGNAADMKGIMRVARKHGIRVIEDAAQAHGTEYHGKKAGSIADMGAFSFFATKHMTTGEGGMLVTGNKQWAQKARFIRSHGMTDRHTHAHLGYNYRMNEIAAAIGLVQLQKLDTLNAQRIRNSLYLIKELKKRNITWCKTPHLDPRITHTFFWCPIHIDEKALGMKTKQVIDLLHKKGIQVRYRYWQPLYKQRVLAQYNGSYKKLYLPHAEEAAGTIIGLPNHPGLKRKELDYIVQIIGALQP